MKKVNKKKCPRCGVIKKMEEFPKGRSQCHICECIRRDILRDRKRAPKLLLGFVTCKICGKQLKTITNTHLKRHDLTMDEYQQQYDAKVFTDDVIQQQLDHRTETIKTRYTPEEIYTLRGKKSVASKELKYGMSYSDIQKLCIIKMQSNAKKWAERNHKLSHRIHQFYVNLHPEEHKRHRKHRLQARIVTNLQKYGIDFPQRLYITKQKMKNTKRIRYGNENYVNVAKCRQTMYDRYGKYSNFFPHFSTESQRLFKLIEERLSSDVKCYYATNGKETESNEYQVVYSNSTFVRYLDFYIPSLKKWIEFDESHHRHRCNHQKDIRREKEIRGSIPGIQLLRIKERTFIDHPDVVVQQCLKFIFQKTEYKTLLSYGVTLIQ